MICKPSRKFLGWILLLVGAASVGQPAQQANNAELRRYSQQAEQALAKKDWVTAATALEALARLTPDVPEVQANLGMAYYNQDHYEQAAAAFRRALQLEPKMPGVAVMLGLCDAQLGDARDAISILEPAFRHPPNREIGRTIGILLMGAYASLDQHFQALEVCEALLGQYPDDPELLYRAAHLYGDRALHTMMRLAQVAPKSPWKQMAFAEALEGGKHYDLAIIQYRKVIATDPGIPGVHYRLGRALLLNAPDSAPAQNEAIQQFQQALSQDPRNAGANYELGELLRRRGQAAQAVDYFSRAVQIDPHFEEAQIGLARSLIHLHQPEEAVGHLRSAIRLNPTNDVSHFLLAAAYKSLGDEAGYRSEMTLFQKNQLRFSDGESVPGGQGPAAFSTPDVTKQTLDSATASRPEP